MKKTITTLCLLLGVNFLQAQTWPIEWKISSDGHQLSVGQNVTGFYDPSVIRQIQFDFPQTNYWTQLTTNYTSNTNLLCDVTIDGVLYDSCGVRFRGQTSYSGGPGGGGTTIGDKKSFNVNMDDVHHNQDAMGYSSLNLLNAFLDPSFLREVIYFQLIRKHIPTAKANFSHLKINGADWGLYPNIQNLNKKFYKEWFLTNDGANWRADAATAGPGGAWGDGTAALNNLGTDSTVYDNYYTLHSSDIADPWKQLMEVCNVLDTVSAANMENVLNNYLDVDRALWYLASEIAFTDDDGYIYKGKMDYYIYEEKETSRMAMIQFDGNSSFDAAYVTSWSPFYNASNANYPLMYRLMSVPALRQRYLAHMRTILKDEFNSTEVDSLIDHYNNLVDSIVVSDPKKIYTYTQFNSEATAMKNFIVSRRNALAANTEMNVTGPTISSVSYTSSAGEWLAPNPAEATHVQASVSSTSGLSQVTLYYSGGIVGKFSKTQMYDDGAHNDGLSGDGVYGADIPGFGGATWVRFYIEATANNTAKTVSYMPEGAEHNVYLYQVTGSISGIADASLTQNLILAPNPATDQFSINIENTQEIKSVDIINLQGQTVLTLQSLASDIVPIQRLASGTYIVRIRLQSGITFDQKLIKQ